MKIAELTEDDIGKYFRYTEDDDNTVEILIEIVDGERFFRTVHAEIGSGLEVGDEGCLNGHESVEPLPLYSSPLYLAMNEEE